MDGWVMVSTRTKPGSVSIAAEKMVAEPCLIMTTEEWWWRWGLVSGESQFVSPAAAALLLWILVLQMGAGYSSSFITATLRMGGGVLGAPMIPRHHCSWEWGLRATNCQASWASASDILQYYQQQSSTPEWHSTAQSQQEATRITPPWDILKIPSSARSRTDDWGWQQWHIILNNTQETIRLVASALLRLLDGNHDHINITSKSKLKVKPIVGMCIGRQECNHADQPLPSVHQCWPSSAISWQWWVFSPWSQHASAAT